jgi:hypothetical protein
MTTKLSNLGLSQDQLDDLARTICDQSMAAKDKELLARDMAKKYEIKNGERFARMSFIPNLNEDI